MSKLESAFLRNRLKTINVLGRLDFMLALGLLITNDLLLKDVYHNWLTGKLSDFAGLYALFLFIQGASNLDLIKTRLILICSFVWWKSGFSQGFIELWNALPVFNLHREVDYSDLLAITILFLPRLNIQVLPSSITNNMALVIISVISFVATSIPATTVFVIDQEMQEYPFQISKDSLISIIKSMDRTNDFYLDYYRHRWDDRQLSYVDSVARYELLYDSIHDKYSRFPWGVFRIEDRMKGSCIILESTFWSGQWRGEYNKAFQKRSARIFERKFIKPIRKREKEGLRE